MSARLLPAGTDVSYLDRFLSPDGFVIPQPADVFHDIDPDHLALWCNQLARYQLPTTELIEFLRSEIGTRTAIEVGAGMGDIGHALGIRMTDSAVQVTPELSSYYRALGQAPTDPPPCVERIDAYTAVTTYRPQVVIACWLTQAYVDGDERAPKIGSSIYGPDEVAIIREVETYIHVGNERVHGDKRALRRPHRRVRAPWIVSRADSQADNVVYVWGKGAQ